MFDFNEIEKRILSEIFEMKINDKLVMTQKGIMRNRKLIVKQDELDTLDTNEMNYLNGMMERINAGKLVIA
ncbi:hypothetical protein MKX70_20155 [Paenibacillus sp. FSL R7-0312]|uniref:hypothetical protein n=1 Tax=Paenibacillus sp. FSL R7-0312 TaxID=2921682 RepID=UPI0030F90E9B